MSKVASSITEGSARPDGKPSENSIVLLAGCLASAAVVAVILARITVWIQEAGVAIGLLPIAVGALVGAAIFVIGRFFSQSNKGLLLAASMVTCMVCIIAEHVFFYTDYRSQFLASAAKNPAVEMFQSAGGLQPATFVEFLAAGARQSFGVMPGWLRWIVDAGLTIVASGVTVIVLHRHNPTVTSA